MQTSETCVVYKLIRNCVICMLLFQLCDYDENKMRMLLSRTAKNTAVKFGTAKH